MSKKPALLPGRNRKEYWGILAPETSSKPFHKPDSYISLLQVPAQSPASPTAVKIKHPRRNHAPLSAD